MYGPPPRLLIYGAVDAKALSRAAQEIGWRPIVANARARSRPRNGSRAPRKSWSHGPRRPSPRCSRTSATAIVILTHDDKFDVPMIIGALATNAFYVGALGSWRNQERRRERLLEGASTKRRSNGFPAVRA